MELVSRTNWRARTVRGAYTQMPAHPKGVKIHYTGGRVTPEIKSDHDLCGVLMRTIQTQHVDGNGWMDIGYSFAVCPHRNVFVGRGLHHVPAANGPGLNSGHYAILAMVGNNGFTTPNTPMLLGIWDTIDYLRAHGVGKEIKGHRDGYPTACPGSWLYDWIRDGAPKPGSDPNAWPGRYFAYPPLVEGNDVRRWQKRMKALGYTIVADGLYGPHSASICRDFQHEKRIPEDGIVGPVTWRESFK